MKVIYDNIKDEYDISEFLTPANDFLPKWYEDIKASYSEPNVRTCASFVEMFKRSMIYRSPEDFWVDFDNEANSFQSDGEGTHMGLQTHTMLDGHDQMGAFDRGFHNLKITSNLMIKSETGRIDAVFMDVFYWDTRPRFRAAQGILPIIDNKEVQFNVNIWVPNFIDRLEIKKGDPIAMLYFPAGIPTFERGSVEITEREQDGGEYLGKMAKCPFGYS